MNLLFTETATPAREFSSQIKALAGSPAEQPPIGMDERRLRDLLSAALAFLRGLSYDEYAQLLGFGGEGLGEFELRHGVSC